jgi:phosphotransferase system HPr (HPr) family protein
LNAAGTDPAVERAVTVLNKNGLHARPSSVLAEAALRFEETAISIRRGEMEVDAKSIMELLLLEAACGTELTLVANGPGAKNAVEALVALFEREFDLKL